MTSKKQKSYKIKYNYAFNYNSHSFHIFFFNSSIYIINVIYLENNNNRVS